MSWEIRDKCKVVIDKCPELSDEGKCVVLSCEVLGKVITLLNKYPELEWGAYMVGEEKEDMYLVTDIVLMKQEVTGSTVEFIEDNFPENCIGWIHSHNSMEVFLSKTDENTAVMYNVTVVVNNKLEFACKVREQLPCGRIALVPSSVKIQGAEIDTSNIIEKNIVERIVINRENRLFPDIFCAVCGQRLSKKKIKLEWCERCERYVHKQCYNTNFQMCLNCIEGMGEYRERSKELWKEYIQDYDYMYG